MARFDRMRVDRKGKGKNMYVVDARTSRIGMISPSGCISEKGSGGTGSTRTEGQVGVEKKLGENNEG